MAGEKIGDMNGKWAVMVKICLVLFPFFGGVIVTFDAWQSQRIITHGETIAAMGANRWTSGDQAAYQHSMSSTLSAEFASLRAEILGLREWIENRYPPPWLLEKVNDNTREIKALRELR
jgi:hypothetical protein